jgi:rare lipoprotein A (peptidoglycan hydrolase)
MLGRSSTQIVCKARKVGKVVFVLFFWPLLMLLSASGLQGPLAAYSSAPLKPIKSWVGLASWYGPGFQGRATANGESFDMFALTAAHPWLPFGSLVRVINLDNGRSQVVRINDRGPTMEDRDLDLSFWAASRLGVLGRGLAKVRIDVMEEPKRP